MHNALHWKCRSLPMGDCSQFYYFLKKVKQKLFITPRRKARPKQKNVDNLFLLCGAKLLRNIKSK